MKYGKAVIVSNRGALPELVKDGVNGYVRDFQQSDVLEKIDIDKRTLYELGQQGKQFFQNTYQAGTMIHKTVSLYLVDSVFTAIEP